MNIKKGDKFLCIRDFYMNSGELEYTKGKVYVSELDRCITDNSNCIGHLMSDSNFFGENAYFTKITNYNFKTYI